MRSRRPIPSTNRAASAWRPRGASAPGPKLARCLGGRSCGSPGLYGPGRIVRRAILERGEPIPGDPDKFLNLIHIDDAASACPPPPSTPSSPSRSTSSPTTGRSRAASITRWRRASSARSEPRFAAAPPGSPEAARDATNKRVANRRMKADLGSSCSIPTSPPACAAALDAS